LRVGMAAGVTLARALGLQLLGVMVLDAIAFGRHGNLVVTTDAKRGELFFARFEQGRRIEGPSVIHPAELLVPEGYDHVAQSCDAEMVGRFALAALANGDDLTEVSAIYLRSADVTPSKGKKVSG
jgi:tRNA threonylcarbamoyladenosine biosynthesis protein TsaB